MLTDTCLIELKQKYIDTIAKYNQDTSLETKKWDFSTKAGEIELNVSRGKVFEKACISTISAHVTIPGRDFKSHIQWLGVQTFAVNPQVPLFMAVFEHVSEQGEERCPGYFDVYPTIPFDEDKEYLKTEMAAVAAQHGKEYQDLTEGYKRMFQVKEAGTGIGYGAGMAFRPEETDAAYFKAAATSIFNAYFHLVEKRKSTEPSPEQMEKMFTQRAEWARFTFMENRFFQGGVQLGVPPECFMLHMLPPLVKF